MSTPSPAASVQPGACYRLVASSADQAAALIREKFGPNARVQSVRSIHAAGWRRMLGQSRLEIVVQAGKEGSSAAIPVTPRVRESHAEVEAAPAPAAPSRVSALLRRTGFSEKFVARLCATPGWEDLDARPLHQALVHVSDELGRHAAARTRTPLPGAAVFFGPSGAGRTTALCKWLAAEVYRRGRSGRVTKVEFDRPNPTEHLAVLCEAMGVPYELHADGSARTPAGGFDYFDLPAMSVRRSADNAALAAFLGREKIQGRVLVLNAAYDPATLRDAYAAGRDLGATHVVFTHLDELVQWGKLWDYLLSGDLEPLFFSTGPSLTGDYEEDVHGALLRRTVPGVTPAPAVPLAPLLPTALAL